MISADDGTGPRRRFDETHAADQVTQVLRRRPVGFAYGSLASGGDILWAEALLSAGAELHVVLPCAIEDFLRASVAPSGPRVLRRVGHGTGVIAGPIPRRRRLPTGSVGRCPASGGVGTAVDVATWRRTGHDVVTVAPVALIDGGDHPRPTGPSVPEAARVIRALLRGDMRGFSKLPDEQLLAFSDVVMGSFARVLNHHGTEVEYRNTWGDALIGVLSNAQTAARCALDLQDAMDGIDLKAAGLPTHLALRLSGYVGPVFPFIDPVLGTPSFMGSHICRAARIEPVTPPGEVYVTETFAASLELAGCNDLACDYVGHMPAAKDHGRLRMYHLLRRSQVDTGQTQTAAQVTGRLDGH